MSKRNQPYLPLYVQDYLTDEKLNECSAAAQGIYVKIMCLMHKSEEYGVILLKQKDKQTPIQTSNFAKKILKNLPFEYEEVEKAVEELVEEGVLLIEGDKLIQKRMVRDNSISVVRSRAGKKGAFAKANQQANDSAKVKQNTENEIENEIENDFILKVKNEILNSQAWLEQICMKKKVEMDSLLISLTTFLDDLELKNELDKPVPDIRQHFINWFNKQPKKKTEKKSITTNR